MSREVAVISFPGTNCDLDVKAVYDQLGVPCTILHDQQVESFEKYCAVIVPGGFSYGDYLRPGAIANFSPAMEALKRFAADGGLVIGICNGFQILCEAQLLPGVLLVNNTLKFQSKLVGIEILSTNSAVTRLYEVGQVVNWPVANFSGSYTVDEDTLRSLEKNDQVLARYVEDINGASGQIAAVCNNERNVIGVMPHPERVVDSLIDMTGSCSGLPFFKAAFA